MLLLLVWINSLGRHLYLLPGSDTLSDKPELGTAIYFFCNNLCWVMYAFIVYRISRWTWLKVVSAIGILIAVANLIDTLFFHHTIIKDDQLFFELDAIAWAVLISGLFLLNRHRMFTTCVAFTAILAIMNLINELKIIGDPTKVENWEYGVLYGDALLISISWFSYRKSKKKIKSAH